MPDSPKYTVSWSDEGQEFVGTVDAYPSLSWLAPTEQEALAGIQEVVRQVSEDMHDDCVFCQGRRAFAEGKSEDDNPFTPPETSDKEEIYESDHFLWGIGYATSDLSRFGTPYKPGERN